MKRAFLLPAFVAAAFIAAVVPTAFAQEEDSAPTIHVYTKTIPLSAAGAAHTGKSFKASPAVAGSGSTIPMWNYSIVAPKDGKTYSGTMVGASPYFNGARTTNIPIVVVPLVIVMPDGSTFDPTATDKCESGLSTVNALMGSPLFQDASLTMNGVNVGDGQYLDEFERASFYETNVATTGNNFHTVLSPVTVASAITINIPANEGASWFLGGCANLGVVDFNTFNSIIANTLPALAANGINQSSFILFLLRNVVMGEPGDSPYSNCCVSGYHAAQGSPVQTYAVADFDSTGLLSAPDITEASHVIGQWMNDPFGTNTTPAWANSSTTTGCDTDLDVGTPLNGWTYNVYGVAMPNGTTYHPQQLAFFSWFFGQSPSLGVGGEYSDAGPSSVPILTFPAKTCTPS